MGKTYYYTKRKFDRNDIEHIAIYFDNGDFVSLKQMDIKNIDITLSDRLINDNHRICVVGVGGGINLRINYYKPSNFSFDHTYNQKEYNKDKKKYIETRCLTDRISHIVLYNHYNWENTIYGNITATLNDNILTLSFTNPNNEPYSDTKSYINLADITTNIINGIDLDFENCDSFEVDHSEIVEMSLNCDEQLADMGNYVRQIANGYILLHLKRIPYRKSNLYCCYNNTPTKYDLTKRLCPKRGVCEQDICHLYIKYNNLDNEECVETPEIRDFSNINTNKDINEEDDCNDYDDWYVGGYCKKIDDKMMLICFGKNSLQNIKNLKYIDKQIVNTAKK